MKNTLMGFVTFGLVAAASSSAFAAEKLAKPIAVSDKAAIQKLLEDRAIAIDKDPSTVTYEPVCERKSIEVGQGVEQTEIADIYACSISFTESDRWNGTYNVMFTIDKYTDTLVDIIFESAEGNY
jgi:hypothetical protein